MRKIYIISLLFIFCCKSFAQSTRINLTWKPKSEFRYGDFNYNIPFFNGEYFQYNNYNKSIKFVFTGKGSYNSIEIINQIFETISAEELGDLKISEIPNSIQQKIKTFKARNEVFYTFSLNPIIKDGNSFKKLISFDYSLSQSSQKAI